MALAGVPNEYDGNVLHVGRRVSHTKWRIGAEKYGAAHLTPGTGSRESGVCVRRAGGVFGVVGASVRIFGYPGSKYAEKCRSGAVIIVRRSRCVRCAYRYSLRSLYDMCGMETHELVRYAW